MGGLAGRVDHIYDDHNLTFYEVKDIFCKLFEGSLGFTEKFDGINIYFSVDPGTRSLLYCRNKEDLQNEGVPFNKFIRRYVGTETGEVFSHFDEKVRFLLEGMPSDDLFRMFEDRTFYNTEILHPKFDSIVKYNAFKVIVHSTGHKSHLKENAKISESLDTLKKYEGDFLMINSIRTFENSVNDRADEALNNFTLFLRREGMKLSNTIGDFVNKKMSEVANTTGIGPFKQKLLAKKLAGRKGVRLNHICSGLSPYKANEVRKLVDKKKILLREVIGPIKEIINNQYNLFESNFTPRLQTEGELKSEGIVFTYRDKLFKITGSYADLIREKNKEKNKVAIIPGSFKPPHKGHLKMFEHYSGVCDRVYVIVSTKSRFCSEGREYDVTHARQILSEFLKVSPLENVVFLFDDHPHKKTIALLNDPRAIKAESLVFIGSSDKGDDQEKNSYIYAERDDIKLLNVKETNYSIKEDLSSTHLRDHITRREFDKVRFFVPEGLDSVKYMEIFGVQETIEKKTKESTSPLSSVVEISTMGGAVPGESGDIQGYGGPIGGKMVDRKKFLEELKLREGIRSTISKLTENKMGEEQKLRKIIRQLLLEKTSPPPTDSTGINVLRTLLKSIIVQLETGYKELTTDKQQRDSFRAHILAGVNNLLAPIEASETGAEEEVEALAEEEVTVDIGKPEDDPEFISIEDEPEEPPEEKPEDTFQDVEGEDETGRNMAYTTFKKVAPQIADAYENLTNQADQNTFHEYLLTNIKLYFDKFEDEMATIVPEPETDSYAGAEGEEVEVIDA
jgi:cytidyltransferase-like protein